MRTTFHVGHNKEGSPTFEASYETLPDSAGMGEGVIDGYMSLAIKADGKETSIAVPVADFVEMARSVVLLLPKPDDE
jgi:hypothetical protein